MNAEAESHGDLDDDVLGIAEAQTQRSGLTSRDGASIDQIQSAVTEAFQLLSLPDHTDAGVAGLITLTIIGARVQALAVAGMVSLQTANAIEHCLQEVRMALVGVII